MDALMPPPVFACSANRRRRVLFVTPERRGWIKTGGLGDVAADLPQALAVDHDVRVLVPGCPPPTARLGRVVGRAPAHGRTPTCDVEEWVLPDGARVWAVRNEALFARAGSPYADTTGADWSDNAHRFDVFSAVAAAVAAGRIGSDWTPDVVHLNDWTSALVPLHLERHNTPVPTLLTIHNLAYQGPLQMEGARQVQAGGSTFLRDGVRRADGVSTVSCGYARQITTRRHGCGLHEELARHAQRGRLWGIVNGIGPGWDPRHDRAVPHPFACGQWEKRARNAPAVRREWGLATSAAPLFAVVARLVPQKGLDLIARLLYFLVAAGGQLVVLGRGDPVIEQEMAALARRFPNHVAVPLGFDEEQARRLYAAADFLLMPSRYEPCGLSQMYAQAYGCLPIAHATGGLQDTIDDGVSGLLFDEDTSAHLSKALQRAFRVHADPKLLSMMRTAAMHTSHAWADSARRYTAVYEELIASRPPPPAA